MDLVGQHVDGDSVTCAGDKLVITLVPLLSGKHLLVFFDSATIIAYGDKAHRKIRRVVETLKENGSCLKTVWYIPQYVSELLSKDDLNKLNVSLNALTSKLQAVIETDPDIVKVTKRADAYYGDPSIVSEYMRYLKKPVMIANLEVGL